MTPAEAALSSLRPAAAASVRASSALPASAASRNRRTADFSADLTALLRSCAASFCRLRLIWDLMFATGQASTVFSDTVRERDRNVRTRDQPRYQRAQGAPKSAPPGLREIGRAHV